MDSKEIHQSHPLGVGKACLGPLQVPCRQHQVLEQHGCSAAQHTRPPSWRSTMPTTKQHMQRGKMRGLHARAICDTIAARWRQQRTLQKRNKVNHIEKWKALERPATRANGRSQHWDRSVQRIAYAFAAHDMIHAAARMRHGGDAALSPRNHEKRERTRSHLRMISGKNRLAS